MSLTLLIGDKNISVWPMRAWLALKQAGVPFREELIRLRRPDTAAKLLAASPAGRVPVLIDGEVTVWDSLAICEYVAERFPEHRLWPEDRTARAIARSITAETHSGFQGLRGACSFQITLETNGFIPPPEAVRDLERVESLWADARQRFAKGGDFLFGHFTIADAFYAPVVARILIYKLNVSAATRTYCDMIWALPAVREWVSGAFEESVHKV